MLNIIKKIQRGLRLYFPSRRILRKAGTNAHIEFPVFISSPKQVIMEADTRIRRGCDFQNDEKSIITIKRYTAISINSVIVTNNHRCTVGIPHILLGISGINDKRSDLTIGEDVWVGANATILKVRSIGRGSIVGASSLVTKDVPPYAVVAGAPAKIVAVKFTIDQILEHEKVLYPENERFSREELEQLFATYYQDKPVYGIQTQFSSEQIERLKLCMKARNFTMSDYIERLKPLCAVKE